MAVDVLSEEKKLAGARLLEACDRFGLAPEGAAWLWITGRDEWELWIVSGSVDRVGIGDVAEGVITVMQRQGIPLLTVWDLHIGSPHLVLFAMLREALKGRSTPAEVGGFSFHEHDVAQAYVYRMDPPIPDAEATARFERFKRAVADLAA